MTDRTTISKNMIDLNDIIELAQEIEITDPIDWTTLNLNQEAAYRMIAASMLEYYEEIKDNDARQLMLLAALTKLSVENFVLNLRLLRLEK